MKISPYFVHLAGTYILGPCVSFEMGAVRIGLSLIFFEVGLALDTGKVWSFGCSGCGAIGYAKTDELPPGWEKRYRRDRTYFFMCANCHDKVEPNEDYVITDENRQLAIEEIIGQFTDASDNVDYIKVLKDYANRLLSESEPFSKDELAGDVCAYADGYTDAMKAKSKQ